MKQILEIVSIRDNEDGSVSIALDMDLETLKVFASIGLLEVFKSKVGEVFDGHPDSEGAANSAAGGEGVDPLSGDFPGF